jgi:uncharacterized repeat protein (TIGR03803 family)
MTQEQPHMRFIFAPESNQKLQATRRPRMGKIASLAIMFCLATVIAAPAQVFSTLASFDQTNGAAPEYGSLVQGPNGSLYGTTLNGGGKSTPGTIFAISQAGQLTPIYRFCSQTNCLDGRNPFGGLVLGDDGNFYGTTTYGGAYFSSGTIFKLTPAGKLTTLYNFCQHTDVGGFCTDGSFPYGALLQGTNGNFYGTTSEGGGPEGNYGTVFEVTAAGKFNTLYRFCALTECADGADPVAGLIQGTDGNFYGTTEGGGIDNGGTVFKITPQGQLTTLYSFCSNIVNGNCTDGSEPMAALIQASNGNFYGTTSAGGAIASCGFANTGCGTIFEITSAGALTTLYNFCSEGGCDDGDYPHALVQATDGNFYGTAGGGGIGDRGTIFQFTPAGALKVFYNFCTTQNCTDGAGPAAGLVQSTNGAFYGTTNSGGTDNDGTVFLQSAGLGAFVATVPTSRKVAQSVLILGDNLTGTTSVSFNGTAATFSVVSNTEIKTTVPAGATTGTVQVITPSGTFSSNVAFQVQP